MVYPTPTEILGFAGGRQNRNLIAEYSLLTKSIAVVWKNSRMREGSANISADFTHCNYLRIKYSSKIWLHLKSFLSRSVQRGQNWWSGACRRWRYWSKPFFTRSSHKLVSILFFLRTQNSPSSKFRDNNFWILFCHPRSVQTSQILSFGACKSRWYRSKPKFLHAF